ncbi:MAG TPA: PQQ-dependent sugar dehydrogenase, partial [Nitrososphaeraceae archaeon]|nr:PQQ-dependent sugar dehydrogenase [Nitrososphaeraceae archaeon]
TCVGVFGTLILFMILNLSSSLFEPNHNSNGIAAIIGVGSISNIGEKGGVGGSKGSSSFYSLFSAIPQYAYAKEHTIAVQHSEGPKIMVNNSNLKIETVFKGGLKSPTSMAFLGPNDILVLEKDNGTVQRIVDGKMLPHPVLKVPVANKLERGMLGIAVARHGNNSNNNNGSIAAAATNTANTSNTTAASTDTTNTTKNTTTYVFLYYTQSGGGKNGDDHPINCDCNYKNGDDHPKGGAKPIPPLGNRLYRYEFDEHSNKLINPKLLLDLPATTHKVYETDHMGGKVLIGPDNNVYLTIGDVGAHLGKAENIQMGKGLNRGKGLDGTGGILRVTQDGKPVEPPLLGNSTYPANIYYAYGIRNSFGIDFDPVTKRLWDTENGPDFGDEINLVNPGFNSGWRQVQGIWLRQVRDSMGPIAPIHLNKLVDFGGRGVYHPPQFTWEQTIGPTAIKFLNSTKLGKQYENDMFVADVIFGNIYHFKLNKQRDGLLLTGRLADKVANNADETFIPWFAAGFGAITDLQVGPDGYLYVLSHTAGAIYRIVPVS